MIEWVGGGVGGWVGGWTYPCFVPINSPGHDINPTDESSFLPIHKDHAVAPGVWGVGGWVDGLRIW